MANEIQVTGSLRVIKGVLNWQSSPNGFTTDLEGTLGPVGGTALVTTAGLDLPLVGLTTPGWGWVFNAGRYDGDTVTDADYVQVGIHDGAIFHSFLELAPGEGHPIKLSRDIGEEMTVPGTGTTGTVNALYAQGLLQQSADEVSSTVSVSSRNQPLLNIILDLGDGSLNALSTAMEIKRSTASVQNINVRVVSREAKFFSKLFFSQLSEQNDLEELLYVWDGADMNDVIDYFDDEEEEDEDADSEQDEVAKFITLQCD